MKDVRRSARKETSKKDVLGYNFMTSHMSLSVSPFIGYQYLKGHTNKYPVNYYNI